MHLKDLKSKTPSDLLKIAEDLKIENAGTLEKTRHDFLDIETDGIK